MSRREIISATKRGRISTKYPKQKKMFYRYGDFQEHVMKKYKLKHDLDDTKATKLIDGILSDWFEKETIEEFCQEDPDLRIQMRKQKEKQLWMDFLFDHADIREIDTIRRACEDILSLKNK